MLYIPLSFECIQIDELPHHIVIAQRRFILLKQTAAYLRILDFEDGVLDVGFLETIKSDYDAVDLGERVIDFSFGSAIGKFYLL